VISRTAVALRDEAELEFVVAPLVTDSGAASPESGGSWVVTHGEPHRANVIRDGQELHLVDWDTTLLAPRERDLQMILDETGNGLRE
jgi:spectinomycin phosphotransferase